MKKTNIRLIVFGLLLCLVVGTTAFANDSITVIFNGTEMQFDQAPVMKDGIPMIPLRTVFEAYGGYSVSWEESTNSVIINNEFRDFSMVIGSDEIICVWKIQDGKVETIKMSVPSEIINGRTLVPYTAFDDCSLLQVFWESDTQTLKLAYPGRM